MKSIIYKIKIINWKKYNPKRKSSFRSVMISERFLDDAKIMTLTPSGKLLFLACLLYASQSDEGCVELNSNMIHRCTGLKHKMIPTCLNQLQSLQLVTYEKNELLMNRNEMNRNEINRISTEVEKPLSAPKPKLETISPKVLEDFEKYPDLSSFILTNKFSESVQKNWLKLYTAEFMQSEIIKAQNWILVNPNKKPKSIRGMTQFVSSWFDRGWERHRKSIPTNQNSYSPYNGIVKE